MNKKVGIFLLSLFLGFAALTFALTYPANAGWMEQPFFSFRQGQTVKSKYFEVNASGWDLRAYVFTTPDNSKTCMFVAGSKKGGLTCWDTVKPVKK